MREETVVNLIEEFRTELHNENTDDCPITDAELESGIDSIIRGFNKMEDFEETFNIYRNDPSETDIDVLLNAFFYQLNKDREMNKSF